MRVKTIIDEDFINYQKASMFIGAIKCDGKCWKERGLDSSICQNDEWRRQSPIYIDDHELCRRYLNNKLTQAIVFGGLEPFEQFRELEEFIKLLRGHYKCMDDVVIYTGYHYDEVRDKIHTLMKYPNIVVKYGRYIPDSATRFDRVLGVILSSENQYAERIS